MATTQDNVYALLHRVNPDKNERRFYLVYTGLSLLDGPAVLRWWGRIGGHQRGLVTPTPDLDAARTLARRLIRQKLRRGYHLVEGEENGLSRILFAFLLKVRRWIRTENQRRARIWELAKHLTPEERAAVIDSILDQIKNERRAKRNR